MFLLVAVLFIVGYCEAGWVNDWDQPVEFECPANQYIYRWKSRHDNGREDRRWEFFCRAGFVNTNCEWSGEANSWDAVMNFRCPYKKLLTGVKSRHDNGREDRIWQFKCCERQTKEGTNCRWTDFINNWDAPMDYSVPTGAAIRGVWSYHDNGREDRRYQLLYCTYTNCNAKAMRILDPVDPVYKNTRIVGITTTQGCSPGHRYNLILGKTDSVTETSSVTVSQGSEFNWGTTLSVSVEKSAKLFGAGVSVTYGLEQSFGGALTWGRSETKETSSGRDSSASLELGFDGPGAAMIMADVNEYEIDRDAVRAAVDVECEDGSKFTSERLIKFVTKTFSQTHFNNKVAVFNNVNQCTYSTNTCIRGLEAQHMVADPQRVMDEFGRCFNGIGRVYKK